MDKEEREMREEEGGREKKKDGRKEGGREEGEEERKKQEGRWEERKKGNKGTGRMEGGREEKEKTQGLTQLKKFVVVVLVMTQIILVSSLRQCRRGDSESQAVFLLTIPLPGLCGLRVATEL